MSKSLSEIVSSQREGRPDYLAQVEDAEVVSETPPPAKEEQQASEAPEFKKEEAFEQQEPQVVEEKNEQSIYFGYVWKDSEWKPYAGHAPVAGSVDNRLLDPSEYKVTLGELGKKYPLSPEHAAGRTSESLMARVRAIDERLARWEAMLFGDGK